jgi:diguanylate cyclase (GGDEF)-like protein
MGPDESTDFVESTSLGERGADSLELIVDTVQQLEPSVQRPFLQKLLRSLVGAEISEVESLVHWQRILSHRDELTKRLGRPIRLRTAAVDYFSGIQSLQNLILLEYRELKRLRQDAATDALTGLYNRRMFDQHVTRELNRSRRYSYPLALLLFDLRNFKLANDTYGHPVGDEALRSMARACTEIIRSSDYACRIGGDEFGLVLPQSETKSAHALAQRIIEQFERYVRALTPDVEVGLDYGVAAYPDNGDSPTSLYEVADRNLYAYKKASRGTPEQASPERKPPEAAVKAAPAAPPAPEAAPSATRAPNQSSKKRRYARISLEGTDARGVLANGFNQKMARVLDLSFGGVSFLLDDVSQLPETFHARLQVPVLPEAEIKLRRVYTHELAQGMWRLGCCFAC